MQTTRKVILSASLLALAASGCSGSTSKCGDGTFRHRGKCLAYDPDDRTAPTITSDPPHRTRAVGHVRLTTDEPATIFYTTDGTTPTTSSANEPDEVLIPDLTEEAEVRAFAVDLTGNVSDVQVFDWELDVEGPAVTGVDLVLSGSQRTVSWTVPDNAEVPDFTGIVVARVEGRLAGPVDGQFYAAGDSFAPGVEVVYAGTDAMFAESLATSPGLVRYAVWAHDDLGNYGTPGIDYETIALPAQTGSLTVNAATGVVTVGTAPSVIGVEGTATYNALTSVLTVQLTLTNGATRVLFAPKLVIGSLSTGSIANSSGTIDTSEYLAWGSALAPSGTATRPVVLSGIGPTDVVTVSFTIADNPVLAGPYWSETRTGSVLDVVTQTEIGEISPLSDEFRGPRGRYNSLRGGFISLDGFMYMGSRSAARVTVIDLASQSSVGGVVVREPKSALLSLIGDAKGGALYGLAAKGHAYTLKADDTPENVGEVDLVRIDPAGPRLTGRLAIGLGRARGLRISPDGQTLAVANGYTEVILVDLARFRVRARIPTGQGNYVQAVEWSADGSTVYAITRGGKLLPVDAALYSIGDPVVLPGTGHPSVAITGSADQIWIGRDDHLVTWDPRTGETEAFNENGGFFATVGGDLYFGDSCSSSVYHWDYLSDTSDYSINTGDGICGHWLGASPF